MPRSPRATLRRLRARHGRQLTRYSIGSVVAAAASQLTFTVMYALGVSATVASVLGFAAGIAPNYQLNRRWAWGRRGRSHLGTEVLPYLGVAATSLLLTVLGTRWGEARVRALDLGDTQRVVLTALVFAVVNGVLFLGKYLVLDRWLFGRRPHGQDDAAIDPGTALDDTNRAGTP